jgi:hypothetical protein
MVDSIPTVSQLNQRYIDKCTGLIQNNKFTSQCGQFTDAAAFYIVACIEDISRTGLLDFGMDSTVAQRKFLVVLFLLLQLEAAIDL